MDEENQLDAQSAQKLEAAQKKADEYERRYHDFVVTQSLLDAAAGEAFNPSHLATIMKGMTTLEDSRDGQLTPMCDFPDTDPATGAQIVRRLTPRETVKRMQELPEYTNLWKSNVASEIGGTAAPVNPQAIDIKNLTQDQFNEIRSKRPELFGLRPLRKGR